MISASCPVPARDAAGVCSSSRPSPQACSRPHHLRLPPPQLGSIHHDLLTTASRKAVHLASWSSAGNRTAYPIVSPNPPLPPCFSPPSNCSRPAWHSHRPNIAPQCRSSPIYTTIGVPNSPWSFLHRWVPRLPRFRALALLGRLLLPRVVSVLIQASEKPQQQRKCRSKAH